MGKCGQQQYRSRRPESSVLYRAVQEGWPQVLAEANERGGLPKRVKEEVRRYLECGVLRHGFAQVRCEACHESMLVAFSCKGRGLCPSCAARRSVETAVHCEAVLPQVAYRQWTLSLPRALRWAVVKTPQLFKRVERQLVLAVWRWQRQRAKGLGHSGVLRGGAVAFAQFFGSALQLTPHLHVLVPEGLWSGSTFVPLPAPDEEEVAAILRRVVKQLSKDFEGLDVPWPEDGLDALWAQGAQQRLPLESVNEPSGHGRRLSVLEGFRLHADTAVHANDRQGLERLCRYGSRGPVAEDRLSLREDGRYDYRTKRGPTLVLTGAQLVKRLVALVPPRGRHLTSFHGVFAPNAKLRPAVMQARLEPNSAKPTLSTTAKTDKPKRPRLDWAALQQRTFGSDVWTCHCGGHRKVLAVITSRRTAEEVLRNMRMLQPRPPAPTAQAPPQLSLAV